MFRAFCLLCLVAASQQVSITQFAVPSAVKVGENVELQCQFELLETDPPRSHSYLKWWWSPLNSSEEPHPIYQRIGNNPPQTTNNSSIITKANDTIELLNMQPKHSGTYECEAYDYNEDRKKHVLIVYTQGSGPLLNITAMEVGPDAVEDVLVTCEAAGVAPEPDIALTINGKEIKPAFEIVNDHNDGTYDIFANGTVSKALAEDAEIVCELFFKNADVAHEAYRDVGHFAEAGAVLSTTEAVEATTDWENSTLSLPSDGTVAPSSSWLLLLALAVPVHLLSIH